MKEGVIDVLMYIFSSYADQDENLPEDRDGIEADLRVAGFDSHEIDKAFDWLDGLAQVEEDTGSKQSDNATRVLAKQESARLARELGAMARGRRHDAARCWLAHGPMPGTHGF